MYVFQFDGTIFGSRSGFLDLRKEFQKEFWKDYDRLLQTYRNMAKCGAAWRHDSVRLSMPSAEMCDPMEDNTEDMNVTKDISYI